jgi:nucleoside-diphosphate-sugar epimerase
MQTNKGKILVTGASGYIASHLIHNLLLKDYDVVGTVRSLANK